MSDILDEILESKRKKVDEAKAGASMDELESLANQAEPRDFISSLQGDEIDLIAEIKPKAPSAGQLTDLDPTKIAWVYEEETCVSGVSCLTDEPYFGMTLDEFRKVRGVLSKPLLRKEFIIDPFQVYQSAVAGADAVLLIASVLSADKIQSLRDLVLELGMLPLVEIHSIEEWNALPFTPQLLGINNRTLEGDFSTDLAVTERIAPDIPSDVTVVSESGIEENRDIRRLTHCEPVDAVLVGTSILQGVKDHEDVRERVRNLMGVTDSPEID